MTIALDPPILIALSLSLHHPGDEIRRVTMETVIPFIKEMFVTCVSKTDRLSDSVKAEYEPFDDYLEMVIQFGVSLIA